tara:strand:+ start:294 stop:398 length:105 start_codon:yes stop_codon:yes gene_type:complete
VEKLVQLDGDFWPFKPTKTHAKIKQEDQEKKEYF